MATSTGESEIARQSARASVLLTIGNFLTTIVGSLGIFIVARLLGPSLYGLYTLSIIPPTFFILFTNWGLNTSASRFASYHLSRQEAESARRTTQNAIQFLLLLGALLSLAGYLLGPVIADYVLHRPDALQYIQIASLAVLGQVMLTSGGLSFIAWSGAGYYSLSNILQTLLKTVLSIALVLLGFGVFGVVVSYVLSLLLAGSFVLGSLYLLKLRHVKLSGAKNFFSDIKSQIRFGVPSELGVALSGFVSNTFVVVLLSNIATNTVVGWYQAAFNITYAVTLVNTAIAYALFPAFSRLYGQGYEVRVAFKYAVKYVGFAVAPVIFFLTVGSRVLIDLVYGRSFLPGSGYLALLSIGLLPIVFGQSTLAPFFNGVGKTRLSMITGLSSVPPVVILAPILGELYGPYGPIVAIIISDVVTWAVGMYLAKKYLQASVDYASLGRILIVSIIASLGVILASQLALSIVPQFIVDALLFVALYLTLSPLIGSIDSSDIVRLESATQGLGMLSRVLSMLLKYEGFLVQITGRSK